MSNLDNEIKKIKKYKRMEIAELEDQIEYYEKQIIKAKKENKTEDINEYEKKIKKIKRNLELVKDKYDYKLEKK
jgi:hypothetical protein